MSYPFDKTVPDFPQAEVTTLAHLLVGGKLETNEDVRCTLAVICYAASQALPDLPKLPGLTSKHASMTLTSLANGEISAAQVNWKPIVSILLGLLQQWLNS